MSEMKTSMFKPNFWPLFEKLAELSEKYADLVEEQEIVERRHEGDHFEVDHYAKWTEIDFKLEKVEKKIRKTVKRMSELIEPEQR